MFNKERLESSEFYNHRFRNFATLSILPTFLFVVCLVAFLIFAKREVAIKSVGEISPLVPGRIVQSSVAGTITINNIKEGKFVKKGETLLVYHDKSTPAEQKLVTEQLQLLTTQSQALKELKASVEKNQDMMTMEDSFGYHQMLKDYLAQRSFYQSETNKIDEEQNAENNKDTNMQGEINEQIDIANSNINDLNRLVQSMNGNGSNSYEGKYSAIYKGFEASAKNLVGDELRKVQSTYQQMANQEIDSNKTNLNSLKIESINTEKSDTSAFNRDEVRSKLQSQQANELRNIDTQLVGINKSLEEYTEKQTILEDQRTERVIGAPASGIIHTNNNVTSKKLIATGTNLAEILPLIQNASTAKVKFFVGSSEISALKPGMKFRLRISRNVPSPFVLNGRVRSLDVGPTETKQGNAFQVYAKVFFDSRQAKQLKYGMKGSTSVITGRETYWNFIIDRILNRA